MIGESISVLENTLNRLKKWSKREEKNFIEEQIKELIKKRKAIDEKVCRMEEALSRD